MSVTSPSANQPQNIETQASAPPSQLQKPSTFQQLVVLPAKTATGKALRGISYLTNQTAVKTLSLAGYYGSAVGEVTFKNLEWLVNNLPLGEAAEIALTFGEEVIKASAEEVIAGQRAYAAIPGQIAQAVGAVGTAIPKAKTVARGLQAVASGLGVAAQGAEAAGALNVGLGVARVQVASQAGHSVSKLIAPQVLNIARKPFGWIATFFSRLKEFSRGQAEDPSWLREKFIDKGDRLLGDAWRMNQSAQEYYDQMAASAEVQAQKITKLRVSPEINLNQFKALAHEEKEAIVYLLRTAAKRLHLTSETFQRFEAALEKYHIKDTAKVDSVFRTIVQEYNKLSQKELLALTPLQFDSMQPHEKNKLIYLVRIRTADLSVEDRRRLRTYQKAITSIAEAEKKLNDAKAAGKQGKEIDDLQGKVNQAKKNVQKLEQEEETHHFLLEQFNKLPQDVKTAVLDISSEAMGEFSLDERRALLSLLVTKTSSKLEKLDKEKNKTEAKRLTEDLKRLQEIATLDTHNKKDIKKIAACFSKYLSAKEKANIRKLFNQKITITEASQEQVQQASSKLKDDLQAKLDAIEKSKGKETDLDLLETAELIESLAYLSQIENQLALKNKVPAAPLPKAVAISPQAIERAIGTDVRQRGILARAVDTVGQIAETALWGAGKGVSIGFQRAGDIASAQNVERVLNTAAHVTEHLEAYASATSLLGAGLGYLGADSISTGLEAAAQGIKKASNMYIDGILWTEGRLFGVLKKISDFEKVSFRDYVAPAISYLAQATGGLQSIAQRMDPLTKQLQHLEEQFLSKKITAAKIGKKFEAYLRKVQRDFGPYITDFVSKNPDSKLKNLMELNYKTICDTILKANPGMKKGTVKFYEEMFKQLQSNWTSCVAEVTKAIPTTGWIFKEPVVPGPVESTFSVQAEGAANLVRDIQTAATNIDLLSWKIQEARHAQKALKVLQQNSIGKLLSQARIPRKYFDKVGEMHRAFQSTIQERIRWAEGVQPMLEGNLEVLRSQTNHFADYASGYETLRNIKKTGEAAASWIPYVGSYIPSLINVYGAYVDYTTRQFVVKIMARTASRSMRIMAPYMGKLVQPSLHRLASLSESAGTTLGSFARSAIATLGDTAERALKDFAITIYEDDVQESYIDQARIKNFQALTTEEKAHLLFVALSSPKAEKERRELYKLLKKVDLPKADSTTTAWKNVTSELIDLFQKVPLSKEAQESAIRLLLQAHDHLNMDERFCLSPASFAGLDDVAKKRIVDVVHATVGLTNKGDVQEIVWKFNSLLKEERDAANTITLPEFRSLEPDEQQDLLYRLVFSDAFKKEFLEGVTADEALKQQVAQVRKFQKALPHGDDLEKLLRLGPQLKDREKGQLSVVQLQQWGQAKIVQAYTLLEENGKLAGLSKQELALLKRLLSGDDFPLKGKAIALLTALYNSKLEKFQQNRLFNITKAQFDEFSRKEKVQALELIVQNMGLSSAEKKKFEEIIFPKLELSIEDRKKFDTLFSKIQNNTEGKAILDKALKDPQKVTSEDKKVLEKLFPTHEEMQLFTQILQKLQDAADCREKIHTYLEALGLKSDGKTQDSEKREAVDKILKGMKFTNAEKGIIDPIVKRIVKFGQEKALLQHDKEEILRGKEPSQLKLLEEIFNAREFPLAKRVELNESLKRERRALQSIQEPARQLIERERNIVLKLTKELEKIQAQLTKSGLDVLEMAKLHTRRETLVSELQRHEKALREQELLLKNIEKQARGENADAEIAQLKALAQETQRPFAERTGNEMEQALFTADVQSGGEDAGIQRLVALQYEPLLKEAPLEILNALKDSVPQRLAEIDSQLLTASKEEREELTLERKLLSKLLELVIKKVKSLTISSLRIVTTSPQMAHEGTQSPRTPESSIVATPTQTQFAPPFTPESPASPFSFNSPTSPATPASTSTPTTQTPSTPPAATTAPSDRRISPVRRRKVIS